MFHESGKSIEDDRRVSFCFFTIKWTTKEKLFNMLNRKRIKTNKKSKKNVSQT